MHQRLGILLAAMATLVASCAASSSDTEAPPSDDTAVPESTTTTVAQRADIQAWCTETPEGFSGPHEPREVAYTFIDRWFIDWHDAEATSEALPQLLAFHEGQLDTAPEEILNALEVSVAVSREQVEVMRAGDWSADAGDEAHRPPTAEEEAAFATIAGFYADNCIGVPPPTTLSAEQVERATDADVLAWCDSIPQRFEMDTSDAESVEAGLTAALANALIREELAPPEIAQQAGISAAETRRFVEVLERAGWDFDAVDEAELDIPDEAQRAIDAITDFDVTYCGIEDPRVGG